MPKPPREVPQQYHTAINNLSEHEIFELCDEQLRDEATRVLRELIRDSMLSGALPLRALDDYLLEDVPTGGYGRPRRFGLL